jgi:hypothetical protein
MDRGGNSKFNIYLFIYLFILFKRWAGHVLVARATEPPGGYPACLRSYILIKYIITRQFGRIAAAARQGGYCYEHLRLIWRSQRLYFVDGYCSNKEKGRGGIRID